jgi:hypothetical protein
VIHSYPVAVTNASAQSRQVVVSGLVRPVWHTPVAAREGTGEGIEKPDQRGILPRTRVRFKIAGLRWIDVDLDEHVIMISQQRTTFGHTTTVGTPKTAASGRTIAFGRDHGTSAGSHRQLQHNEAEKAAADGEKWVESGYVFTDPHGQPLNPDYLTRRSAAVNTAALPPSR